jgi:hypothetical protein
MKKKLLKKSEKNYKYFKYFNNILLRLTQRASKLQEKLLPSKGSILL